MVSFKEIEFAHQTTFVSSDPLFSSQWHNTGTAAVNINITNAWNYFTGAGVRFGVYDDGVDSNHVDLAANYDASLHVRVGGIFDDPTIYNSGDAHGTAVAGLIAAVQGNGQGGVGGSFNGRLTGVDIFGDGGTSYLFGAMNEQDRFDVTNHSWGWSYAFTDNSLSSTWSSFFSGLQDAAANGRAGLGTIQMVAAGNGRDAAANANTSNFTASRFVNAIAGISDNGEIAYYSTPGASLLVASPTDRIVTTDYTGSVGYDSSNYTSTFNGTSAATPIASGVVGLILEANPELGYRDVMEILAITAQQIGSPDGAGVISSLRPWAFNGASNWNNGGMHFSHDYGFGLIDAFAAVKLAESWNLQQSYANELVFSASNNSTGAVPDNNAAGISRTVNLTPASGDPISIEAIEVKINWSRAHTWSGDLVIELISPTGMTSYLLDRAGGSADLSDWIFTTRAHLGELATGAWTVRVSDHAWGDTGTISSITVRAYGSRDVGDNYYYTDEFGAVSSVSAARRTLTDTDGGSDTINLAALSAGASINLNPGEVNVVSGSSFAIAAGTNIENVIGSWYNDTIVGNTSNNILNGNAGNDSISGSDYNPILTAHGQIYRLYQATLDRAPDEGGFGNWATALANGATLAGITTGFINSAEFQARYSSLNNTQFVTLLYNNVLDRTPDIGGLSHWVGELANGATRESIVNGFSESAEFIGNAGLALNNYMRSISIWQNTLDGGAGDDTLLGGRGVDTFVFNANEDGSDTVYGLEDWDLLRFDNFGYTQASDVFRFLSEVNGQAVFSDQGVSVTFFNTPLAGLDTGMVLI